MLNNLSVSTAASKGWTAVKNNRIAVAVSVVALAIIILCIVNYFTHFMAPKAYNVPVTAAGNAFGGVLFLSALGGCSQRVRTTFSKVFTKKPIDIKRPPAAAEENLPDLIKKAKKGNVEAVNELRERGKKGDYRAQYEIAHLELVHWKNPKLLEAFIESQKKNPVRDNNENIDYQVRAHDCLVAHYLVPESEDLEKVYISLQEQYEIRADKNKLPCFHELGQRCMTKEEAKYHMLGIQVYSKAAQKGHTPSLEALQELLRQEQSPLIKAHIQFELGKIYMIKKEYQTAIDHYEQSGREGGEEYKLRVEQELQEIIVPYVEASNRQIMVTNNNREKFKVIQYALGKRAEEKNEWKEAIQYYGDAAQCGHKQAFQKLQEIHEKHPNDDDVIFELGLALFYDKKDVQAAITMFAENAHRYEGSKLLLDRLAKSHAEAAVAMGDIYLNEWESNKEKKSSLIRALDYYYKAASKGNAGAFNRLHQDTLFGSENLPDAQYRVARLYQYHPEFYKNGIEASMSFYSEAALQGHQKAYEELQALSKKEDRKISTDALFYLGKLHQLRSEMRESQEELSIALSYYYQGVERGDVEAGNKILEIISQERYPLSAETYYWAGRHQEHLGAHLTAIESYVEGSKREAEKTNYGFTRRDNRCFRRLSELKSSKKEAAFALGKLYEWAFTQSKEDSRRQLAVEAYREAYKAGHIEAQKFLRILADEKIDYAEYTLGYLYEESRQFTVREGYFTKHTEKPTARQYYSLQGECQQNQEYLAWRNRD